MAAAAHTHTPLAGKQPGAHARAAAAGDNEPDGPVTLLTKVETMLPLAAGAKL